MTTPADPDEPVIESAEDVRRALAEKFLKNSNEENDDMVQQIRDWKRKNK